MCASRLLSRLRALVSSRFALSLLLLACLSQPRLAHADLPGSLLKENGFSDQAQNIADAAWNAYAGARTKGETWRGGSGPLINLALNSTGAGSPGRDYCDTRDCPSALGSCDSNVNDGQVCVPDTGGRYTASDLASPRCPDCDKHRAALEELEREKRAKQEELKAAEKRKEDAFRQYTGPGLPAAGRDAERDILQRQRDIRNLDARIASLRRQLDDCNKRCVPQPGGGIGIVPGGSSGAPPTAGGAPTTGDCDADNSCNGPNDDARNNAACVADLGHRFSGELPNHCFRACALLRCSLADKLAKLDEELDGKTCPAESEDIHMDQIGLIIPLCRIISALRIIPGYAALSILHHIGGAAHD